MKQKIKYIYQIVQDSIEYYQTQAQLEIIRTASQTNSLLEKFKLSPTLQNLQESAIKNQIHRINYLKFYIK